MTPRQSSFLVALVLATGAGSSSCGRDTVPGGQPDVLPAPGVPVPDAGDGPTNPDIALRADHPPIDGASDPSPEPTPAPIPIGAACTSSRACGSGAWCNLAGSRCQARSDPPARSFTRDVLPFIVRNGCKGCHGPGGVGAVAGAFNVPLVLTGTDWESYQALVAGGLACPQDGLEDGKANRLCVSEPSQSLLARRLLTLPGEVSPHGPNPVVLYQDWSAPELQMLLEWIAQGATFDGMMTTSSDAGAPAPPPDAAPDLPPPPPDKAPDLAPDLAPDQVSVDPDDVTAPVGAEVTALAPQGCGVLAATWSAADDGPDGTPARDIRYQLCHSQVREECTGRTVPGGSFVVKATLTGMTSFRIAGLASATYFVSVRALDQSGNTSGVTAVLSRAVTGDTTPPTMPPSLTATRGPRTGGDAAARTVTLSWLAATDDCTAPTDLTYQYCDGGTSCATWTPLRGAGATRTTIQQNTPCVTTVIGLRAADEGGVPGPAITAIVEKRSCFAGVATLLLTKCNPACHQVAMPHRYAPFTWDTLVRDGVEQSRANCPPRNLRLVVPGNAFASYLTQIGPGDNCRNINMLYDSFLSATDREAINLWINDGAVNSDLNGNSDR